MVATCPEELELLLEDALLLHDQAAAAELYVEPDGRWRYVVTIVLPLS